MILIYNQSISFTSDVDDTYLSAGGRMYSRRWYESVWIPHLVSTAGIYLRLVFLYENPFVSMAHIAPELMLINRI